MVQKAINLLILAQLAHSDQIGPKVTQIEHFRTFTHPSETSKKKRFESLISDPVQRPDRPLQGRT